ncbi:hypothetical protein [Methylomagnum sp.]
MQNRQAELARNLSKLISAIQKHWMEQLGEPEAPLTEAAMHKAHRLLTAVQEGTPMSALAGGTVADFLGRDWLDAQPWARPHVQKIQAAVDSFGNI